MNSEEHAPPSQDEQLLPLLLACDNALAGGTVRQEPPVLEAPPELRQRLEDDLACIQLLRQVLPRPATPKEKETDAAPSLPLRQLGRFTIHRELGQGAFGMVFLATDRQLGRPVALKIPRPEALLTAELRERFIREARAAAGLDHPHLVPVYEAGSEGPLCYIASAYCPGITLAQWLTQRSEAVPLRVAAWLVGTLARAVQHAHERGVIHRDLKPSNVLLQGRQGKQGVAEPSTLKESDGDSPPADVPFDFVPRITDFGLAKLTTEAPSAAVAEGGVAWTQSGAVLGTPNYMAPEQASGKNKEIGPAADGYALGGILYELLTGRPPFRGETVLDTLEQVRTREPLPPSRLRPRLPRDMETICLKCLAKEPHKRYASAAALADDLGRYLAGQPIQARPIGRLERTVKWARRKPAQAMLLGTAIALVAVVLGYTVTLRHTVAEKEQQRQEAIKYFGYARQAIDEFAIKVGQDKRLLAHDLEGLRKGLIESALDFNQKLAEQRPDDPDMQFEWGRACHQLAMLLKEMGATQKAIDSLLKAIEIFKKLRQENPDKSQCQVWVANGLIELGRIYGDGHMYELAENAIGEACDILRQLAADHPEIKEYQGLLASSIHSLGVVYKQTGRSELTEAAYGEAQGLWAALVRANPEVEIYQRDLGASHFNLGRFYLVENRTGEAEESFGQSYKLWRKLANTHPDLPDYQNDLADSLFHLGLLYVGTNRIEKAVDAFNGARRIYQQLADSHTKLPKYQNALADVYNNLGLAYERLNEPERAETAYGKSCAVSEQLIRDYPNFPDYQSTLAQAQGNLGHLFADLGQPKQAITYLDKSRQTLEKLAHDYPSFVQFRGLLAEAYINLAELEGSQGKSEAALHWLEQAVQVLEVVLKQEPRRTVSRQSLEDAYKMRAQILIDAGRFQKALQELDQLLKDSSEVESVTWRLLRGLALSGMGQYESAMIEVEKVARGSAPTGPTWYNLACICARCSTAVRQDAPLNKAERDRRIEQYEVRAVEFLQKAKAVGYFEPASAIERIRKDKDLAMLRGRPDFQELMRSLRPKDKPKDGL